MLRYALRRLSWVVPMVFGVALVTFWALSSIPGRAGLDDEARRRQFLDLPRFFNVHPVDVQDRTVALVDAIQATEVGSAEERRLQHELQHLGGAALPVLIPRLDSLTPQTRTRIALALAPVAARMGISHRGEPYDPERAVLFWQRFWDARGVEFSVGNARTAVRRYEQYGAEARTANLFALDTYALPFLMEDLERPSSLVELDRARRLVTVIAHVTARSDRIEDQATVAEGRASVDRWRRWWLVHEADFTRTVGVRRAASYLVQTQLGKWMQQTVVLQLGRDASGRPLFESLRDRGQTTVAIVSLGLLAAYLGAIALGVWTASRRGHAGDRLMQGLVLLPYTLTPVAVGVIVARHAPISASPIPWAAGAVAVTLLADPFRQQRAALVPILVSDFVIAAKARGASRLRILAHGVRSSLPLVFSRAATEVPLALSACFVVEHALGIDGISRATILAVERRDIDWLMAIALVGAVAVVVLLVVSDLAHGALDPRVRQQLGRGRRRRAT